MNEEQWKSIIIEGFGGISGDAIGVTYEERSG